MIISPFCESINRMYSALNIDVLPPPRCLKEEDSNIRQVRGDTTDLLSHVFLPLILIYAVRRKLKPYHIALIPFTVLPDLDKFLGMVGLLHSLVTTIPLCLLLVLLEWTAGKLTNKNTSYEYSLIASFYILSHFFLDILDGGPVTLLYPFVKAGIGLSFPATLELGSNPFEFSINNIFPQLVYMVPKPSKSYEILSGFGVASVILFLLIVSFDRLEKRIKKN